MSWLGILIIEIADAGVYSWYCLMKCLDLCIVRLPAVKLSDYVRGIVAPGPFLFTKHMNNLSTPLNR